VNKKLRELLTRVCAQLDVRAEYDPTYAGTEKPVNAEASLVNELRLVLDDPAALWTALSDGKPDGGIRVIGASETHVFGDVYYGRGGLTVGRMGEEGYAERQIVECWRYTESGEQVPKHLPMTHWQDLPDSPVPQKKAFHFLSDIKPAGESLG
jgi:hypothetical protein